MLGGADWVPPGLSVQEPSCPPEPRGKVLGCGSDGGLRPVLVPPAVPEGYDAGGVCSRRGPAAGAQPRDGVRRSRELSLRSSRLHNAGQLSVRLPRHLGARVGFGVMAQAGHAPAGCARCRSVRCGPRGAEQGTCPGACRGGGGRQRAAPGGNRSGEQLPHVTDVFCGQGGPHSPRRRPW